MSLHRSLQTTESFTKNLSEKWLEKKTSDSALSKCPWCTHLKGASTATFVGLIWFGFFFIFALIQKEWWFTFCCQLFLCHVLFPEFLSFGGFGFGVFFLFWHTVTAVEIHCHNVIGIICAISSSLKSSVELHRLKPSSGTRLVPVEAGVKLGHQRPHCYLKMHDLGKRFKDALAERVITKSKWNTVLHVNWANLIWNLLIHSIPRSLKSMWCGMDIWSVWEKLFVIPSSCISFLMYYFKENS